MPVPDFQTLMVPMLRFAEDGKEHTYDQFHEAVAKEFALTEAELQELLPSGRQTRLKNRIGWSKSYMAKAGLLEAGKRGKFSITERGRSVLAQKPARIDIAFLSQFAEFEAFRSRPASGEHATEAVRPPLAEETPEEVLEASHRALRHALVDELLAKIRASPPDFFERLVVDVLVAMGYGGSRKDAGQAVGRSGDEGIDGIIKEDRLGLDAIYLQAKRWKDGNNVGRPGVQAFVGSLEGHRARKGVFITASDFSADAREYVGKIEKKVVLISGRELAEMMIDHGVGVTTAETYIVRKLDNDYFDESE